MKTDEPREEFQAGKAILYTLPSAALLTSPLTIQLQESILYRFGISFQLPEWLMGVGFLALVAGSVVGSIMAVRYCDRTLPLSDCRRIPLRLFNLLALIVILSGLTTLCVVFVSSWFGG